LDFDSAAAAEATSLAAAQQKSGRSVDMRDTQIAGIALVRHAALATRAYQPIGDDEA
jgi:toxin FitB